jgi:hypothetical protein
MAEGFREQLASSVEFVGLDVELRERDAEGHF